MSRAEYYRQYRQKKKQSAPVDKLDAVIEALQDVAQLLRNTCEMLAFLEKTVTQQCATCDEPTTATVVNDLAQRVTVSVAQLLRNNVADVAQQIATVAQQDNVSESKDLGESAEVDVPQHVAKSVAQQPATTSKPKRKGFLPPSSPPSLPPQTPPNSPPLLSPHHPKEKPAQKFAISSGGTSPDARTHPDVIEGDYGDMPLIPLSKNTNRDLATWNDLVAASTLILDETYSYNLQDVFIDWIEYKQERGPKEFYTRKGIIAEARRFIKRHLEGVDVSGAINRAVASNWQGWDHDLSK